MRTFVTLFAALVVMMFLSVSSAQTITYNFTLDGSQEVPAISTAGTGTGIVTINTSTNFLEWDISYSGLTSPVNGAHFHGPAGPGANAGIRVDIGAISGLASPMVGNTTISSSFTSELTSGLWYVNIHTNDHGSGEIRGQVVPEPTSLALLATGVILLRRRRTR